MVEVNLELAARKSIASRKKISLKELGFKITNDDDIQIRNTGDYSSLIEPYEPQYNPSCDYEKLNFIYHDEEPPDDFDHIISIYKDEPLVLATYYLEAFSQKKQKINLTKIANHLYEYFFNKFNLLFDNIVVDIQVAIYYLLKMSDTILRIGAVLTADNILNNYTKYDVKKFSEKQPGHINDFFNITEDLNMSKQLVLASKYYFENIDRVHYTNKDLEKIVTLFKKSTVKTFVYNLFMSNRMSSIINTVLFIQSAPFSIFKTNVISTLCTMLEKEKGNK